MLDYKIHELDRQIKPREKTIKLIDEQVGQMNQELDKYKRDNTKLLVGSPKTRGVRELKLKLAALEADEAKIKAVSRQNMEMMGFFRRDLHKVYQIMDKPNELVKGVKRLYQEYGKADLADAGSSNSKGAKIDVHEEYQRFRTYLERSVESLECKIQKDASQHRYENARIVQENVALIREINELKREIRSSILTQTRLESKAGKAAVPADIQGEMDDNQREIETLQQQYTQLQTNVKRPASREILPPIAQEES